MTTYIGKYLNPGEIYTILQNERLGRRKARLKQVREIARKNAAEIRASVNKERNRQCNILADQLKMEWLKEKQQQIDCIGELYGKSLQEIGEAHSKVQSEESARFVQMQQFEADRQKAHVRGSEALNKLRCDKELEEEQSKHLNDIKKSVRAIEDSRARYIATLPPPKSLTTKPISLQTTSVDEATKDTSDVSVKVTRIDSNDKVDAYAAAKLEESKQNSLLNRQNQEKVLNQKKERMRYLKAKTHMNLQKDYNKLLMDLDELAKQELPYNGPDFYQHDNCGKSLEQEQEKFTEDLFSNLNISIVPNDESNHLKRTCLSSEEMVTSSSSSSTSRIYSKTSSTPIVHLIVCDSTSSSENNYVTPKTPAQQQYSGSESLANSYICQPASINSPETSVGLMDNESSEGSSPLNGANTASVLFKPTPKFIATSLTNSDETILAGHLYRKNLDPNSVVGVSSSTTESSVKEETSISQASGVPVIIDTAQKLRSPDDKELKVDDVMIDGISKMNFDELSSEGISSQNPNVEITHGIQDNEINGQKQQEQPDKVLEVIRELPTSQHTCINDFRDTETLKERAVVEGIQAVEENGDSSKLSPELFQNVQIRRANNEQAEKISTMASDASQNEVHRYVEISKTIPLEIFKMVGQRVFGENRTNVALRDISLQESVPTGTASYDMTPLRHLNDVQTRITDTSRLSSFAKQNNEDHHYSEEAADHRRFFPSSKGQLGFDKVFPTHELSVVLEVDTPNSSHQTSGESSSILSQSLGSEIQFPKIDSYFVKDQLGITDELDLTLVSADYSGCSSNKSHLSTLSGLSVDTSRYVSGVTESLKSDAFVVINVKSTSPLKEASTIASAMRNRNRIHSSLQGYNSEATFEPQSFSLSSFSSSRSSYSVNSKTPTLSSSDSFGACFVNESLQSASRQSSSRRIYRNGVPNFAHDGGKNSKSENNIISLMNPTTSRQSPSDMATSSANSYFTPKSTLDDTISESLLSFILNERLCTDVSDNGTSNCTDISSSGGPRHPKTRDSCVAQREVSNCSPSESLISFLRHEKSITDESDHL